MNEIWNFVSVPIPIELSFLRNLLFFLVQFVLPSYQRTNIHISEWNDPEMKIATTHPQRIYQRKTHISNQQREKKERKIGRNEILPKQKHVNNWNILYPLDNSRWWFHHNARVRFWKFSFIHCEIMMVFLLFYLFMIWNIFRWNTSSTCTQPYRNGRFIIKASTRSAKWFTVVTEKAKAIEIDLFGD